MENKKYKYDKETLRKIREEIDIIGLAQKLSIGVKEAGTHNGGRLKYYVINCPNPDCNNDKIGCVCQNDNTKRTLYNRFHCFDCGKNFSTIDLVMLNKSMNFNEAVEYLLSLGTVKVNCDNIKKIDNNINLNKKIDKNNKIIEYNPFEYYKKKYFDEYKETQNDYKFLSAEYLKYRNIHFTGITNKYSNIADILKKNHIYFKHIYEHDINYAMFYFEDNKAIIKKVFKSDISKIQEINGRKLKCRAYGNNSYQAIKANNNSDIYYICEGLEDAFTLLQFNKNIILLNSVNNIRCFLNEVDTTKTYIICTDNDEAGIKCKEKIEEYFNLHHIKFNIYKTLYESEYNDLSDLWNKKIKSMS